MYNQTDRKISIQINNIWITVSVTIQILMIVITNIHYKLTNNKNMYNSLVMTILMVIVISTVLT